MAASGAGRRFPIWLLAVGTGIVVGVLSGLGGETAYNAFPVVLVDQQGTVITGTPGGAALVSFPVRMNVPPNFNQMDGYTRTGVRAVLARQGVRIAERRRAEAAFGLLGALLGVGLGLAGGLARGTPRSAMGGALTGGLTGIAYGVVFSLVLVPVFFHYQDAAESAQFTNPDAAPSLLVLLFLTHAGICAGIGLAAGMALGLGSGDRKCIAPAMIAGLAGACIGVFLFETINSLAFPLMRTFVPMPEERVPRLLAHACVAVATAFLAGLAAELTPRQAAASPALAT
jgi:hypothetical protein